jgi:tetratricopeptide (TPR) repeat protein
VPGSYTISVVFRNRALKRYTVAEKELAVPDFSAGKPALAGILLGYKGSGTGDASLLEPSADSVFAIGDTIFAFAQAVNPPSGATLRYDLLLGDAMVDEKETTVVQPAELATLGAAGGSYRVRARLRGPDGTELAETSAPLALSPRTSLPRPNFVYRRGFNPEVPGLLPLVLGDQWWNLGKPDQALSLYEKAVAAGNRDLPQARWKLAHAYLSRGHTSRALELLSPMESAFPTQYEVVAGIGLVYSRIGDDAKAVSYLERALALRPPDVTVLNALGASHRKLGNTEKAKDFLKRSLDLDPDQPAVRELLDELS